MKYWMYWIIIGFFSFISTLVPVSLSYGNACRYEQQTSLDTLLQRLNIDSATEIATLIEQATEYQTNGEYNKAKLLLEHGLQRPALSVQQKVLLYSHLTDVFLVNHKITAAEATLEKAFTLLKQVDQPLLSAHLFNNAGNIHNVKGEYSEAQADYERAFNLSKEQNNHFLRTQIFLNRLHSFLKQGKLAAASQQFPMVVEEITQQTHPYTKIFNLLAVGQLGLRIQKQKPEFGSQVYEVLQQALELAEAHQDERSVAYAKGYLGQLYENAERYQEALYLTRQAIFLSQNIQDLRYRWEWQLGRIFFAQGDKLAATGAYRRALASLQPIRATLTRGQRDSSEVFSQRIRPVYFGLANLLLLRSSELSYSEKKQQLLKESIDTLEKLKKVELQNYFQDECVTAKDLGGEKKDLNHLKHTAVFYPVLLPDRTELLLSTHEGIFQKTVSVSSEKITKTATQFQQNLQLSSRNAYLRQSLLLYKWLIHPLRDLLDAQQIKTIVTVPDGALRMIPLSALHDGKNFLFNRFAFAITPSLDLTTPSPLSRSRIRILLNGLSEGVQGFEPLPNVPKEIETISSLFNQSSVLLDQRFSLPRVNESLQENPYVIIHIASHGQFSPNPKDTFLLTYDDKITMDRLERLLSFNRFRKSTIELLTLSACQTAVGDERAALGLAGVAIKAGARSALASLWFINDVATSQLITEFYQQLQNPEITKAEALRNAQAKLANQPLFRHPMYWAAFLVIGNWL